MSETIEEAQRKTIILRVKGKVFRCDCGSNCFTLISIDDEGWRKYKCNGCRSLHEGKPVDA